MPTDLLTIAGLAAELLEGHGFIACGRKQDGITRVDFWTRDGAAAFRFELRGEMAVEEVVSACLALTGTDTAPKKPTFASHLN